MISRAHDVCTGLSATENVWIWFCYILDCAYRDVPALNLHTRPLRT